MSEFSHPQDNQLVYYLVLFFNVHNAISMVLFLTQNYPKLLREVLLWPIKWFHGIPSAVTFLKFDPQKLLSDSKGWKILASCRSQLSYTNKNSPHYIFMLLTWLHIFMLVTWLHIHVGDLITYSCSWPDYIFMLVTWLHIHVTNLISLCRNFADMSLASILRLAKSLCVYGTVCTQRDTKFTWNGIS